WAHVARDSARVRPGHSSNPEQRRTAAQFAPFAALPAAAVAEPPPELSHGSGAVMMIHEDVEVVRDACPHQRKHTGLAISPPEERGQPDEACPPPDGDDARLASEQVRAPGQ